LWNAVAPELDRMYTDTCSLSRVEARHERLVCSDAKEWDCDRRLG